VREVAAAAVLEDEQGGLSGRRRSRQQTAPYQPRNVLTVIDPITPGPAFTFRTSSTSPTLILSSKTSGFEAGEHGPWPRSEQGSLAIMYRQAARSALRQKICGSLLKATFTQIIWLIVEAGWAQQGAHQSAGVRTHVAFRRMWL